MSASKKNIKSVLIFTGGLNPTKADFKHCIKRFAPPDLVIAADSGLVCAHRFGYKADLIVGDMDSLVPASVLDEYPDEKILRFERDKDDSDTVIALKEAIAYAQSAPDKSVQCAQGNGTPYRREELCIVLCGGDGGRLDHLLGIVKQFETPVYPDVWLCRKQTVYNLRSGFDGTPRTLIIEAQRCKEHVSIFPVPTLHGDYRLRSQGLVWPLEKVDWHNGAFSLSNRACGDYVLHKKDVVLTAEKGAFIVIAPY